MAAIGSIDLVETASEQLYLTVTVKRAREFGVRLWLVCRLLAVAGWISPVPLEIKMHDRHAEAE